MPTETSSASDAIKVDLKKPPSTVEPEQCGNKAAEELRLFDVHETGSECANGIECKQSGCDSTGKACLPCGNTTSCHPKRAWFQEAPPQKGDATVLQASKGSTKDGEAHGVPEEDEEDNVGEEEDVDDADEPQDEGYNTSEEEEDDDEDVVEDEDEEDDEDDEDGGHEPPTKRKK